MDDIRNKNMTRRCTLRSLLVLLLLPLTSCTTDALLTEAPAPNFLTTTVEDVKYHIAGHGILAENNLPPPPTTAVVVNALRLFDGTIMGTVEIPDFGPSGLPVVVGPVLEIVPPSATHSHWCIEFPHSGVSDGIFIVLGYIRDIGDGQSSFDQVAFGGDYGATCVLYPDPFGEEAWYTLLQGDFKTSIQQK
jgi:hypothetical protein